MRSNRLDDATLGDSLKVTRRQIVPALAALAVPARPPVAGAETRERPIPAPQAPAPTANPSSLEKAQDDVHAASERLRKIEIPMDLEPAFAFRP
jgi:hypothetical protein